MLGQWSSSHAVSSAAAAAAPAHARAHPELSWCSQRAVGSVSFRKAKRNRSCLLKILCFIFQKHERNPPILLCLCLECLNRFHGCSETVWGVGDRLEHDTRVRGLAGPTCRIQFGFPPSLPLQIHTPLLLNSPFNQQEDPHTKMAQT